MKDPLRAELYEGLLRHCIVSVLEAIWLLTKLGKRSILAEGGRRIVLGIVHACRLSTTIYGCMDGSQLQHRLTTHHFSFLFNHSLLVSRRQPVLASNIFTTQESPGSGEPHLCSSGRDREGQGRYEEST